MKIEPPPHIFNNFNQPRKNEQNQRRNDAMNINVRNIHTDASKIANLGNYLNQFGEVINVNPNVKYEEQFNTEDLARGIPTIRVVYNPANPSDEVLISNKEIIQKAPIGSNLKFESEKARKLREKGEKEKLKRIQREKEIRSLDSTFKSVI